MSDENDIIQLDSSSRTITIHENGKIESTYRSTAYPIGSYLARSEGEVPEEEFEKLNDLLEDVEEPENDMSLLNPATWFSTQYIMKKGDKTYEWVGKGSEELEEAVNEIDRLSKEYASEIKY